MSETGGGPHGDAREGDNEGLQALCLELHELVFTVDETVRSEALLQALRAGAAAVARLIIRDERNRRRWGRTPRRELEGLLKSGKLFPPGDEILGWREGRDTPEIDAGLLALVHDYTVTVNGLPEPRAPRIVAPILKVRERGRRDFRGDPPCPDVGPAFAPGVWARVMGRLFLTKDHPEVKGKGLVEVYDLRRRLEFLKAGCLAGAASAGESRGDVTPTAATVVGPETAEGEAGGPVGDGESGRDVPDERGYVESPVDPAAYVSAADIVAKHTPLEPSISMKELGTIVESYDTNRVRWTRPIGRNGRPKKNRRSVHLGDWAAYLQRRAGTDADGFPRLSETEIERRKVAVRKTKRAGK